MVYESPELMIHAQSWGLGLIAQSWPSGPATGLFKAALVEPSELPQVTHLHTSYFLAQDSDMCMYPMPFYLVHLWIKI